MGLAQTSRYGVPSGAANFGNGNLAPSPGTGLGQQASSAGTGLAAQVGGNFSTQGGTSVQFSAGWLAVLGIALVAYVMWVK